MSTPSEESGTAPLPLTRLLLRRQRDSGRRLENQLAQGRPDASWRKCGDETCTRPAGHGGTLSETVKDKESNRNGVSTKRITEDYADEMVGILWPEKCLARDKSAVHRAVEALVASPPTRCAFWQFQEACQTQQLDPSEKDMRRTLESLLPMLRQQWCTIETLMHQEEPDPGGTRASKEAKLHAAALAFVVDVELWRRKHWRFRSWIFRDWGEAAEFLETLLLQLWFMDREGCFEQEVGIETRRRDELWQAWFDDYPVVPDDDDDDDEGARSLVRASFEGWGQARRLGGGE